MPSIDQSLSCRSHLDVGLTQDAHQGSRRLVKDLEWRGDAAHPHRSHDLAPFALAAGFILDRTLDVALFALLVAFVILFGLLILGG